MNKNISILKDKNLLTYVVKFVVVFCICYFGTLAVIGIAAPGGYYNSFVDKYLDYVSGIKNLLIFFTRGSLSLFGIKTVVEPNYLVRILNGRGVYIAMDCVGYGVYSFWIAYVLANKNPLKRKILWAIGGVVLLFLINDIRITLFLLAINKGWPMPLGLDHHTWFNIIAYLAIGIMMYFFERNNSKGVVE